VVDDQTAPLQRLGHDPRGVERMKSLAPVLQNPDQRAIVNARYAIAETKVHWPKTLQAAAVFDFRFQGD